MRINEALSPAPGLFAAMPDNIWGSDLDPSLLDVELFVRIGELEASPLFRHFVSADMELDVDGLAALIHQRFQSNWGRIWDALLLEYNLLETSSVEERRMSTRHAHDLETRDLARGDREIADRNEDATGSSTRTDDVDRTRDLTSARNDSETETRNLTETGREDIGRTQSGGQNTVRTGSITSSGRDELSRNLVDTETRDLTNSERMSGTDRTTDTFDETTAQNSTLTKTGSENTTGSEDETHNLKKTEGGTLTTGSEGTQTGNGSSVDDRKVYGVGGAGAVPESQITTTETRDFADTTDSTETRNLTSTESGTVDRDRSETLTFTGRKDATTGSESHTGSITHTTVHGQGKETTEGGNVRTSSAGTEAKTLANTETFNRLTDTETRSLTDSEDRDTSTRQTGTVGRNTNGNVRDTGTEAEARRGTESTKMGRVGRDVTARDGTETGTVGHTSGETNEETFTSHGSSPLRTFQALIQEEIDGRTGEAWNFTDIVIRDVQSMIASKVWNRRKYV